ncbi:hypothetical protein Tco_0530018 [Tanacetum coccineum]
MIILVFMIRDAQRDVLVWVAVGEFFGEAVAGFWPGKRVVGGPAGNDLDNVTFYIDLHIDGESTEVDAPPDIIDVPGEDDDIRDDEDPLPHDLADSDMADVARAHGGDGGGEDPSRPPPPSFGCAGCFVNRDPDGLESMIQSAQFGKTYNTNKATLKREHWIKDPETGAYDLDQIRRGKPDEYTDDEWEKYINFWNDPANAQRAKTNRLIRPRAQCITESEKFPQRQCPGNLVPPWHNSSDQKITWGPLSAGIVAGEPFSSSLPPSCSPAHDRAKWGHNVLGKG